eukprot:2306262-Pyramimonas_sp.AAC.1
MAGYPSKPGWAVSEASGPRMAAPRVEAARRRSAAPMSRPSCALLAACLSATPAFPKPRVN